MSAEHIWGEQSLSGHRSQEQIKANPRYAASFIRRFAHEQFHQDDGVEELFTVADVFDEVLNRLDELRQAKAALDVDGLEPDRGRDETNR